MSERQLTQATRAAGAAAHIEAVVRSPRTATPLHDRLFYYTLALAGQACPDHVVLARELHARWPDAAMVAAAGAASVRAGSPAAPDGPPGAGFAERLRETPEVSQALTRLRRAGKALRDAGGEAYLVSEQLRARLQEGAFAHPDDELLDGLTRHCLQQLDRAAPADSGPGEVDRQDEGERRQRLFYEEIRHLERLPSPDRTALVIQEMAQRPTTSKEDLAEVIANDPALSGCVLRYVNCPLAGQRQQVSSIFKAVNMLGITKVRDLALAVALMDQCRQGPCGAFDYGAFWAFSVATATVARHIGAIKENGIDQDIAFTAGLLCQIGQLAFATAFPAEYACVLRGLDKPVAAERLRREHLCFAMNSNELGALLLADWNLPEAFCWAVRYQDAAGQWDRLRPRPDGRVLGRVLLWARVVAAVLVRDQLTPTALAKTAQMGAGFGIDPSCFSEHFEQIKDAWAEMGIVFDVRTRAVPSWEELCPDTPA